jgi:hypothetical protein
MTQLPDESSSDIVVQSLYYCLIVATGLVLLMAIYYAR